MSEQEKSVLNETGFSFRQDSFWDYLLIVPTWIGALALFILMSMTFFDVIFRSIFDNPIESATELTRMFMAIIVFTGLPLVSWKGDNIAVDLLDPLFTSRMMRLRDSLIDFICGVILFWPAKRVWELAERSKNYGDVTEYLNFPQHYIAWFIAVFTGLTAIAFIARAVSRIVSMQKAK